MTLFLSLLLSCTCTQAQPATPKPPTDWPPLPNFQKPVDYAAWLESRWTDARTSDAAPLFAELFPTEGDSDKASDTKYKRLGEATLGGIPGLFTGHDPIPDRYAWDPADHPEWEIAYQTNHKLRDQMLAASRKQHYILTIKPAAAQAPTQSDHLLLARISVPATPILSTIKILLQNAWRSPGGKTDSKAMKLALTACIRLARQQESPAPTGIQFLGGLNVRQHVYRSAFRALYAGVLNAQDIDELAQFLATEDKAPLDPWCSRAAEAACFFDLFQAAYSPGNPPKPNRKLLDALVKELSDAHKLMPDVITAAPLDLVSEIGKCAPAAAAGQLIRHELAARKITASALPQDAAAQLQTLGQRFDADPANHVLLRQYMTTADYSTLVIACARVEASRRALRTVLALHREHAKTGQWPTSLQILPQFPAEWRKDPFSGKDFLYRVTAKRFTLYSVGANGKDDNGRPTTAWDEGWATAESEKTTPTDQVFWPLNPPKPKPKAES